MNDAAAAHAASATLIVQSRRKRGGRRRNRTDDIEEEKKQDEERRLKEKEELEAAKKLADEQAYKEAQHLAMEAEKRAADLLIQLELEKKKVLNAFTTENLRFNEQVQKSLGNLDIAARFADRDKFMKEVTKLNKLDKETSLLLNELESVSQRKARTKARMVGKESKEGEEGKNSKGEKEKKGNGKGKGKHGKKEKNSKSSEKDKDTVADKPVTPKKGIRLDTRIKKVLKEMPPQLGSKCKSICKRQRMKAYNITGKNVRDIISACGENGFIEDILKRKFILYKSALQKTREARGEKSQRGTDEISKDELAGLAGGYPLCAAVRQGQHNICKFLLEMLKGDAVNMLDATGLAPILLAARAGYDLMTKYLLDNGAFADAVDSGRCNALMLAARQENRFFDAERKRRTDLQKEYSRYKKGGGKKKKGEGGGDNNDDDNSSFQNLGFRPLEKNHNNVLKLLIAVGANINHRDLWGRSVLTHAAECGNHAGTRMLLKAGARVDSADNKKMWTSIHYAVFNGHFFTAHNLIKGGANVNVSDNNGITPLILASNMPNQIEMVKLLIHSGADTGLTSTYGQSCASCARDRNDDDVLDIIRNGVDDNYDPNNVVIYIQTSRGKIKRRRKKKKKNNSEEKISDGILNPKIGGDDRMNPIQFHDDDSGVEDIKSDEDYGEDEDIAESKNQKDDSE
jgi:ankyrin repeat protein